MKVHQEIHDFVRMGSTIKNISYDMQLVHRQTAYGLCKLYYVLLCNSAFNNGIYNLSVVICTVGIVICVEQLVHTVIHIFRQPVTYTGTCIFCGYRLADGN